MAGSIIKPFNHDGVRWRSRRTETSGIAGHAVTACSIKFDGGLGDLGDRETD
jgi:hypothetical protein